MVTIDKMGGRTIEFYIPFEWMGKKHERISFSPFNLGHVEKWRQGYYKGIKHMMSELSGISEEVITQIKYPDADRVMTEFFMLVPDDLKPVLKDGWADNNPVSQDIQPNDEPEEVSLEDQGGFDLNP